MCILDGCGWSFEKCEVSDRSTVFRIKLAQSNHAIASVATTVVLSNWCALLKKVARSKDYTRKETRTKKIPENGLCFFVMDRMADA